MMRSERRAHGLEGGRRASGARAGGVLCMAVVAVLSSMLTSCGYPPPMPGSPAVPPRASAPDTVAVTPPPTSPMTAAAIDSTPSLEALQVLASIPDPLTAEERVPPPDAVVPPRLLGDGSSDSARVPVPSPTAPLGSRPRRPAVVDPAVTAGADSGQALSDPAGTSTASGTPPDTSAVTASPGPATVAGTPPDTSAVTASPGPATVAGTPPDTSAVTTSPGPATAAGTPPASTAGADQPAASMVDSLPATARASDPDPCWRVQIAAPSNRAAAESRRRAGESLLLLPMVIEVEQGLYKVRSVPCMERPAIEALRDRARAAGFEGSFPVRRKKQ